MLKPILDGFVLSASQIYIPDSFRANALANMEVLRRAAAYRNRQYLVPNDQATTIAAYNQYEQQIMVQPGSYIWGLSFYETTDHASSCFIQITDACTEIGFWSDYVCGSSLLSNTTAPGAIYHNPVLLSQPRMVGEPGLIDVEIYNKSSSAVTPQLVVFVAEPAIPPEKMQQFFDAARIGNMIA